MVFAVYITLNLVSKA